MEIETLKTAGIEVNSTVDGHVTRAVHQAGLNPSESDWTWNNLLRLFEGFFPLHRSRRGNLERGGPLNSAAVPCSPRTAQTAGGHPRLPLG